MFCCHWFIEVHVNAPIPEAWSSTAGALRALWRAGGHEADAAAGGSGVARATNLTVRQDVGSRQVWQRREARGVSSSDDPWLSEDEASEESASRGSSDSGDYYVVGISDRHQTSITRHQRFESSRASSCSASVYNPSVPGVTPALAVNSSATTSSTLSTKAANVT